MEAKFATDQSWSIWRRLVTYGHQNGRLQGQGEVPERLERNHHSYLNSSLSNPEGELGIPVLQLLEQHAASVAILRLKLNWNWFSVGRISRLLIVCVIQHYPSTLYYWTLWDLMFHQAQAWPHHGWFVTMLSGSTCQYEDGGNKYKPDITRPYKIRNSMELHGPAMIFVAYWDNCSLQPCLPLALRRSLNKRHSQRWATAVAATVTTGPLSRDRVHLVAFLGHSCCWKVIRFLIFCINQGCVLEGDHRISSSEQDRVRRKAKDKSDEQITIAYSNLPARNHFWNPGDLDQKPSMFCISIYLECVRVFAEFCWYYLYILYYDHIETCIQRL